MNKSNSAQEIRLFLRDMLRPFGFRNFARFLRGSWWVILPLLGCVGLMLPQSPFAELVPLIKRGAVPDYFFKLVKPDDFDLFTSPGVPYPAIDREGDLIPVISSGITGRDLLRLWSISRHATVMQFETDGLFSEKGNTHPRFMFHSEARGEFVVALGLREFFSKGRIPATLVLVNEKTLAITKRIFVDGLCSIDDISPSGRFLVGLRRHWVDKGGINGLMQPVIVDLETGDVSFEPVRVSNCVFESDESLICIRSDSIFRYHWDARVSDSSSILLTRLDDAPESKLKDRMRMGMSVSIDYFRDAWRSPRERVACVWKVTHPPHMKKKTASSIVRIQLDGSAGISVVPVPRDFYYYHARGGYEAWAYAEARTSDPTQSRIVLSFVSSLNPKPGSGLLLDLATDRVFVIQPEVLNSETYRIAYLNSDLIWVGEDESLGWYIKVADILKGQVVAREAEPEEGEAN